jgi:hypothetical protein
MGMFKKKAVVIEAHQWDGSLLEQKRLTDTFGVGLTSLSTYGNKVLEWRIPTLEGSHIVSPMDWIIKGVKGEFYPCKPDVFEMTHEESK